MATAIRSNLIPSLASSILSVIIQEEIARCFRKICYLNIYYRQEVVIHSSFQTIF